MHFRSRVQRISALVRQAIGGEERVCPTCSAALARLGALERTVAGVRSDVAEVSGRRDLPVQEGPRTTDLPQRVEQLTALVDELAAASSSGLAAHDRRITEAHRLAVEGARAIEHVLEKQLQLRQSVDAADGSGR